MFLGKEKPTENSVGFVFVSALPIFAASHPATIVGENELNFCVRDGNRWTLVSINTDFCSPDWDHTYQNARCAICLYVNAPKGAVSP